MSEPKYKKGQRVSVGGWSGSRQTGTVTGVSWIYHRRLYEHCWGYYIEWDEGCHNPLTLVPTPQGYVRSFGPTGIVNSGSVT